MTDFRALCAELVDDLELCDWPYKLKETIRADIDRARAALADGPAAPDGLTAEHVATGFGPECHGVDETDPNHNTRTVI